MIEQVTPANMTLDGFLNLPKWAQDELQSHYHDGVWINVDASLRYCFEILRLQGEIAKAKKE
jgi:hypothetical protein